MDAEHRLRAIVTVYVEDGAKYDEARGLLDALVAERDSLRNQRDEMLTAATVLAEHLGEKLVAAEARVKALDESLRECIPYVNRALNPNDPDNAPWRIETATGVMERLRAALGEGQGA